MKLCRASLHSFRFLVFLGQQSTFAFQLEYFECLNSADLKLFLTNAVKQA